MDEKVLNEIIDACVVAIDLLGIDVKKEYPNLHNEFIKILALRGKTDE